MRQLLSLRQSALLIIIFPTVIIGLLLGGYLTYKRNSELNNNLIDRGIFLSEPLTLLVANALQSGDVDLVENAIDDAHLKASPIVRSISIFYPDHKLLRSSNVHPQFNAVRLKPGILLAERSNVEIKESLIFIRTPIYGDLKLNNDFSYIEQNGQYFYGYLVVELNREQALLSQQTSLINVSLILLVSVLFVIFFALVFVRYIFDPIEELTSVAEKISKGNSKVRAPVVMDGELESLRKAINAVAKYVYIANERAEHNISEYTQELQQTVEQLEIQNIQLNMAKREAQNANDVKSQFLANMSHELRTPLNGVLGFTRQLGKTRLNTNQIDFLETIELSANNLLRIINDILDYSKLDAKKMELDVLPFTLRDTVNEVMTLMAPAIFDKGLEIHLNIDVNIPDELLGDSVRLRQILINLIGNSTKFTKDGFIRLDIKYISSNQLGHHVKFIVTDSGIGINDEYKEKLFIAFGQADSSITRNYGGTGLGLMICKKLIEAMNGGIHFNSEEGKGSQFYFDIYIKENSAYIGEVANFEEIKGKKLLYFDVCPQSFLDIQQGIFEYTDVQLVACDQEDKFYSQLQSNDFDIVLIGRKVAPSNIVELKKLVKFASEHCPYVYTLINSISPNIKESIINSGAKSCLSMPLNYRKLFGVITEPYQDLPQEVVSQQMNYSGVKVLAVDDTEANLKLLHALLSEMSIEAELATDGLEGLEKAQKQNYDIIFMDIQMPVMDGITACQKIRASSLNEETPIISVTAHAGIEEQQELISSGFTGFLPKPIDEEVLKQVILDTCPGCQVNEPNIEAPKVKQEESINLAKLPPFVQHPIIDWPLALSRSTGKQDLAIEMFTMLLNSLPDAYSNICNSFEQQDVENLLKHIHKLHGACCYTGVPKLKDLVEVIEIGLKKELTINAVEPELLEVIDLVEGLLEDSKVWKL